MKYFRSGNLLYGIVYSVWRGLNFVQNRLSTWFYRAVIFDTGAGTIFSRGVYVSYPRRIHIGKNVIIGKNVLIGSETSAGDIWIKDNVQISDGASIDFTGRVIIESHALISPSVKILSHDHGYDPHALPVHHYLEIGEYAWIGLNAVIMPGVGKIGKYAIVGAGAIVIKPVPDYAIVAGNPAKVIKMRPDAPPGIGQVRI